MREFAFALLRILAIAYLCLEAIPYALAMLSFLPSVLERQSDVLSTNYLLITLVQLVARIIIPLIVFFLARPLARIAVPDRPLEGVALDARLVGRAAFIVGGVVLIVKGAVGILPILAETFEALQFMARHLSSRSPWPYNSWYLADGGEVLAGLLFLWIARRMK